MGDFAYKTSEPQAFDSYDKGNEGRGYTNQGITLKNIDPYKGEEYRGGGHFRALGKIAKPGAFSKAVEGFPESENVEDRRLKDKTIGGYKGLVESADKEGLSQVRQLRSFAKRRGSFGGVAGGEGAPLPRRRGGD